MKKTRKQIIKENEISEMYTFTLGNMPQKVLLEGKKKDLPIVITLHGGPGTPIPFSAGCRGLFPEFTERFIMVYWDQLGCGINNYNLKSQFHVESFVEMTIDLIEEVKKRFPANKLILFGMSWGSVLALKAVQKMGKKVDGVVIWGQVLNKLFLNEEVYEALERAGLSEKKLRRVRRITVDNFTDKEMQFLSGSIRNYTNGYINKKGKQAPMGTIIQGLLTSPDYKFRDFKAMMINGTSTSTCLWTELLKLNLTKELLEVNVPYYILQGDTDIVTSTLAVVREVEASGNSCLNCCVIPDSGHMPGEEGMKAIFETLVNAAYL
ncbi:MAG: alpha/beta hydrolase [Lachnospiraceae bacterium]|nr:alpha/beta hydrolase [Lachnospiraceae bacterium]